jgi:hypothetical protein
VPVDVVKERLQIQRHVVSSGTGAGAGAGSEAAPYYKSSMDAVKTIFQTEGIRGIYRGYAATLLSFGPFSALYFSFYEKVNESGIDDVAVGYFCLCFMLFITFFCCCIPFFNNTKCHTCIASLNKLLRITLVSM